METMMEEVKKFTEIASKIGSFGIAIGFGTWFLYTGALAPHSPNVGLCAIGAALVISAMFFDFLVWNRRIGVSYAREKTAQQETQGLLDNPPGRPPTS